MKIGIEKTEAYLPLINDKNVAVVSNHTSKFYNSNKSIHLVDSLLKLKVNIIKVFAPEHGFRGNLDAGEKIVNTAFLFVKENHSWKARVIELEREIQKIFKKKSD